MKKSISRKQAIAIIQDTEIIVGRVPTARDLEKAGMATAVLTRLFGGHNKGIIEAGLLESSRRSYVANKELSTWIKENQAELARLISNVLGPDWRKSDYQRRLWVLNDEGLYRWARSEGVNI